MFFQTPFLFFNIPADLVKTEICSELVQSVAAAQELLDNTTWFGAGTNMFLELDRRHQLGFRTETSGIRDDVHFMKFQLKCEEPAGSKSNIS